MGLPRPDAGTPVHDYLGQHWSRMVILNWPCGRRPVITHPAAGHALLSGITPAHSKVNKPPLDVTHTQADYITIRDTTASHRENRDCTTGEGQRPGANSDQDGFSSRLGAVTRSKPCCHCHPRGARTPTCREAPFEFADATVSYTANKPCRGARPGARRRSECRR